MISNRAVQYVRMSTDMQENSVAIQAEAIALFAARAGLTIIRSYEDLGRSGLKLDRRTGLQKLITDVRSGSADFQTILIYDVSRWGRFQDTDESAYYEFICRSNGISIEYCAEQFRNDGSVSATILKTLKRAMAGEFSRELSAKVFAGQAKTVANGFHRGSVAGYGLRRCLVDGVTGERTILQNGQRKRLSSDRIVLVPGPPEEQEIIAQIYVWFVSETRSLSSIARRLNELETSIHPVNTGTTYPFVRFYRMKSILVQLNSTRHLENLVRPQLKILAQFGSKRQALLKES